MTSNAIDNKPYSIPIPGDSDAPIPGDSKLKLALSAIPLFGSLVTMYYEGNLERELKETTDAPRLIKLLEVKNRYKAVAIGRDLITLALSVAAVALGVMSLGVGSVIGAVAFGGFAALGAYQIYKNRQLVKELQNSGFRQGMQFF
jgi:hypothetical protein